MSIQCCPDSEDEPHDYLAPRVNFPQPDEEMISSHPVLNKVDPLDSAHVYPSTNHRDLDEDTDGEHSSVLSDSTDDQERNSNLKAAVKSGSHLLHPVSDTVEHLRPDEVRWFYREETDKQWITFIGYDSLRIETKYQELRSHGDLGFESTNEMILVRGGLFEANVLERTCLPIYWTVTQSALLRRGSWFRSDNWQPLEEELADQIELEHMSKFEGVSTENSPYKPLTTDKKRQPINTLKFSDSHVDWYDVNDLCLYTDSPSLFIRQKLGMQKVGVKLRRGYCYEALMDDKPADVTHLCFVIHGIGQKMHTGSIVKCCADLRQLCAQLKERHFPDADETERRVEFLPVEWRSSLRLDGDTVDSITPEHLRGLRAILNGSAMDILYYTSPLYRSEIVHGLQTELNRLYSMFCTRHPYFEGNGGKVSIIAHSLGAVITYDIIMGWNPIHQYDQFLQTAMHEDLDTVNEGKKMMSDLQSARKRVTDLELELMSMAERRQIKLSTQSFRRANFPSNFKSGMLWRALPELDHFFCLGSPLPVFLALRGVRPGGSGTQEHFIPKSICARIYNIYHPADPVAYRLEPLVLKSYSTIHPVFIHRHNAPNRTPYCTMPRVPIEKKKKGKEPPSKENGRIEDNFNRIQAQCEGKDSSDSELAGEEDQQDGTDGKGKLGSRFSGIFSCIRRPRVPRRDEMIGSELQSMQRAASADHLPCDLEASISSLNKDHAGSTGHLAVSRSANVERLLSTPTFTVSSPDKSSPVSPVSQSGAASISDLVEQTELEHRIDYQLREGRYESSYLSVLTAHTSYWSNRDVAMFIMTQLMDERENATTSINNAS